MQVSCYECELRACGLFKPISPNELGAINEIKRDHIVLARRRGDHPRRR